MPPAQDRIQFGIQTVPQHTSWRDLLETWKLMDAAGYDTAWTFDHFYPIFSDPAGPCFEGWIALTALAAATSRIRCGTLVTGNTYRHPAVLANMGATLDHTSNGRLIMGLGAAWFDMEHHAYAIPFPPVGERIARLDESCHVIRSLWKNTETTFDGKYYQLKNARCEPKPVQKPHPPIMIGGGGEKKTLRVVARHADLWNWFGSVENFRQKLDVLRSHCAAVGRDPSEIEATWTGEMWVTPSPQGKAELLRQQSERRKQSADEIEGLCLVGSPDEIEARIRSYVSVGVRHFIISAGPPYDHDSIRRFAEDVIPRFR